MKQLLCVVLALMFAVSLAACTHGNNDETTAATTMSTTMLQTTTTSSRVEGSTTKTETTTTTGQNNQSTTDYSDATTTITNVVTTTHQTDSSGRLSFYSQHPNVPDYGAMLGLDYDMYKDNVYYYRVTNAEESSLHENSGPKYMQLLSSCGYVAYKNYNQDGIEGYLYVNSNYGIVILFGAAPSQGAIVVAISQQ